MLQFLKKLLLGLNELATLGGASASRNALAALREEQGRYQAYYERAESQQKELEQHIACIGTTLTSAQKTLLHIERVLQQELGSQAGRWKGPSTEMFDDIRRFKQKIHGSLAGNRVMNIVGLGAGATTGGAFSVGSWALVASLGSASTGAAISGLTGVAATNATLAWFGGGAIAAGGAGMSGGSVVLGLLAMTPVIALSTWLTYRQAKKHSAASKRLIDERRKLEQAFHSLLTVQIVIHKKQMEISAFCDDFHSKTRPLLHQIQPAGLFNWFKRTISRLKGRKQFTPEELQARDLLAKHVQDFLQRLAANKFI